MDQDDKKSFCLLRFEINWTSAAEDVENFATFSVHGNGSFKKCKWFPEDLTSKTIISSQYNILTNLKKYGLSHFESIYAE